MQAVNIQINVGADEFEAARSATEAFIDSVKDLTLKSYPDAQINVSINTSQSWLF